MFVYQGKLNWYDYANNETITIIFPHNHVRPSDPVYVFSQWTKSALGFKKVKWFQTILVQDMKKVDGSDNVTFTLPGSWYTFKITTEASYSKINVDMSSLSGGHVPTFTLLRTYQPNGSMELKSPLRIWTGPINISDNAVEEQAIFVSPNGLDNGNDIFASWQWTKSPSGKAKETACYSTRMSEVSGNGGIATFSFQAHTNITSKFNDKTGELSVSLQDNGKQVNIGNLSLWTKIIPYSHSFNEEELAPPQKKELPVRSPQPQATLRRVVEPMPFPKTLLETLTHGAAFIEQAGYLTVQAENRFKALDLDYHKQVDLVNDLKKAKQNLEAEIARLIDELKKAKDRAKDADEKAERERKNLQDEIDKLRKKIKELEDHDIKDEDIIKELREENANLQSQVDKLKEQVDKALAEQKRLAADILALQGRIGALEMENLALRNELDAAKALSNRLSDEVKSLKAKLSEAQDANKRLAADLANSQKEHAQTKAKLSEVEIKLRDTEATLKKTAGELESTKKTLADTEQQRKDALARAVLAEKDLKISKARHEESKEDKKSADVKSKSWEDAVDELQDLIIREQVEFEGWAEINKRFKDIKNGRY
ncbi:hypothetical protein FLONG3_6620 [Fusarium longipes]|uniref:Hard-surface inducible n=1 Tax=Fusarium longipes TaxID=694270 RepID=A0A395SKJ4_9HYPO|nr:hypothetical protein FLONG3_6620 [Fusarium longipes]